MLTCRSAMARFCARLSSSKHTCPEPRTRGTLGPEDPSAKLPEGPRSRAGARGAGEKSRSSCSLLSCGTTSPHGLNSSNIVCSIDGSGKGFQCNRLPKGGAAAALASGAAAPLHFADGGRPGGPFAFAFNPPGGGGGILPLLASLLRGTGAACGREAAPLGGDFGMSTTHGSLSAASSPLPSSPVTCWLEEVLETSAVLEDDASG
mmetsp:Transcript_64050/g.101631  ORF Transcript_64050/g.101631 Transcript_64050/m.101631 type:complete len:205 (-) Transcript_64050:230-844(-)